MAKKLKEDADAHPCRNQSGVCLVCARATHGEIGKAVNVESHSIYVGCVVERGLLHIWHLAQIAETSLVGRAKQEGGSSKVSYGHKRPYLGPKPI